MGSAPVAILKSHDLSATVRWYRGAGFEIGLDEPTMCEVSREGLTLQFLSGPTPWEGPATLTGCFYVHVPDLDAAAGGLDDSIQPQWGIEERDWGSRELVLQDPDGYFITFTTPRHAGDEPVPSPAAAATAEGSDTVVSTTTTLRCWCCDGEFAEVSLVRLGARPEVTICLDCARHVKRRAVARTDEHRWTPQGAVRRGIDGMRNTVIENGWHQRGPLGAALRRIDRFLP